MNIDVMKQAVSKIRAAQTCHLNATKTLLCEADDLLSQAIAQAEKTKYGNKWMHDCAALLQNDVDLWIDRCPHCGKPHPPTAPAQPQNK